MMLVSTISYIDRNTLALLAPTILRDTHLPPSPSLTCWAIRCGAIFSTASASAEA
jgi:hypothetical protein